MKNNNKKYSKVFALILMVLAFTFTSNSHATSGNWFSNWWGSWGNNNHHTHYRGCGHSGYGGGNYHTHYRGCGHSGYGGGRHHTHYRGCGHSSYGGGNQHTHYRGCGHDGGGNQGGGDSIPLDGGLSILLIGAAAFGVKKLRGNKNDKN
ncbi:hypothetical protein MBM09_10290 [Flaviramulus sp. BrNp1-15]|uniref:PID-CTERM protein-sorting domain-containing protein n=1 Tax=Flaviramulus sp. BrNp1-15 TaxID=2916754 RepID=UPI001EE82F4D|nr:hypothetical protein [Flaviramulus sp. BrNp1-15]ULC58309.1 hypothetical protein MBM09_10290 [Flaviramulus sp. BrNp1-15]